MRVVAALACGVLACGNAPAHGGDGAPIDAPPTQTHVVTLAPTGVFDPIDFIAYRNGSDGPWQTPAMSGTSSAPVYTLDVADDYIVVDVCAGDGAFDAEEYGFTFAGDGSSVSVRCFWGGSAATGSVTVTGVMQQAGTVNITYGAYATSATGPWTYRVDVPTGFLGFSNSVDVVAIDTANRVVFDRGLAIGDDGSATGPTLDTGSGAPLLSQPLTVSGLGSGEILLEDWLDYDGPGDFDVIIPSTGSGTSLFSPPTTILSMPLSLLGSDDTQQFTLMTSDGRGAAVVVDGANAPPADYELLPAFATVTAQGSSVSWTTLPVSTFSYLQERVYGSGDGFALQQFTASSSWVAARNATSMTFDTSAPGYQAAWTIAEPSADVALWWDDPATGILYDTLGM